MPEISLGDLRQRLSYLFRLLEWFEPHMTWLMGLMLLAEVFYPRMIRPGFVEHPDATLILVGVLVIMSGRLAVGYRRQLARAQQKADFYQEQYEEVLEGRGDRTYA